MENRTNPDICPELSGFPYISLTGDKLVTIVILINVEIGGFTGEDLN